VITVLDLGGGWLPNDLKLAGRPWDSSCIVAAFCATTAG
jgi:hypothetical protein